MVRRWKGPNHRLDGVNWILGTDGWLVPKSYVDSDSDALRIARNQCFISTKFNTHGTAT